MQQGGEERRSRRLQPMRSVRLQARYLGVVGAFAVLAVPVAAAFTCKSWHLSLSSAHLGRSVTLMKGKHPRASCGLHVMTAGTAAGKPGDENVLLGLGTPRIGPAKKLLGSKRLREAMRRIKLKIKSKVVSQLLKESQSHVPTLLGSKKLAKIAGIVYGDEILNGQLTKNPSKQEQPAVMRSVSVESRSKVLVDEDKDEVSAFQVEDFAQSFSEVELMWMVEKWKQEESGLTAKGKSLVSGGTGVKEVLDSGMQEAAGTGGPPWMEQFSPDKALTTALLAYPETKGVSDYTLGRFYELGKGNPEKAALLVKEFVAWQNSPSYGVERVADISADTPGVSQQIQMAKCYLLNKNSKDGCPVVLVRVCRHDPDDQALDETTRFVCYALAQADARLKEPRVCQYSVLFDMTDASMKNVDYQAVKRFVFLLTNYCPSRLYSMLIFNAPSFFSTFCFPLIKPWLNPATREKVHFVSSRDGGLVKWMGKECLPVVYGGNDDFDYDKALSRGETISFVDGQGNMKHAN